MTFRDIKAQIFLRLARSDGEAMIAANQGINNALQVIAAIKDFDELKIMDTEHAFTVKEQKIYHVERDLGLVRPKDIYSIRLMDEANSRKLTFVPAQLLDKAIPYTELTGIQKSSYYTWRGRYIELYPIPDDRYPLYIFHSQWPAPLVNDEDEPEFINIDYAIVALATEMTQAILQNLSSDWVALAKQLLQVALNEEEVKPDQTYVARPFRPTEIVPTGAYWLNPWVRRQPE